MRSPEVEKYLKRGEKSSENVKENVKSLLENVKEALKRAKKNQTPRRRRENRSPELGQGLAGVWLEKNEWKKVFGRLEMGEKVLEMTKNGNGRK